MARYILKAATGIHQPEEQELDDWSDEDYQAYMENRLSEEKIVEIRGVAHEIVHLDYWIEKID